MQTLVAPLTTVLENLYRTSDVYGFVLRETELPPADRAFLRSACEQLRELACDVHRTFNWLSLSTHTTPGTTGAVHRELSRYHNIAAPERNEHLFGEALDQTGNLLASYQNLGGSPSEKAGLLTKYHVEKLRMLYDRLYALRRSCAATG